MYFKNYELPLDIFIEEYFDEDTSEDKLDKEYNDYYFTNNGVYSSNDREFVIIYMEKNNVDIIGAIDFHKEISHLIDSTEIELMNEIEL